MFWGGMGAKVLNSKNCRVKVMKDVVTACFFFKNCVLFLNIIMCDCMICIEKWIFFVKNNKMSLFFVYITVIYVYDIMILTANLCWNYGWKLYLWHVCWSFAAQHSFSSGSSTKQKIKSVRMVYHFLVEYRECNINIWNCPWINCSPSLIKLEGIFGGQIKLL